MTNGKTKDFSFFGKAPTLKEQNEFFFGKGEVKLLQPSKNKNRHTF